MPHNFRVGICQSLGSFTLRLEFNAPLVVQTTEQLLYVKIISSVIQWAARSQWYFTRHNMLSYQDKNSSKVSKTDAAVTNIPSSVSVPQEDVTENP
jgi:hypothetical protein